MRDPRPLLSFFLFTSTLIPVAAQRDRAGLQFQENKGQWPDQVLYRVPTGQGAAFVEKGALTYVLRSGGHQHGTKTTAHDEAMRAHAFRVHFENGQTATQQGLDPFPHYENHFVGNDPSKWASRVRVFGGTDLREVYPGITLHVTGASGLTYDWLVAPGADPADIVLRYEGQQRMEIISGRLVVHTSAGTVTEEAPVAWQEVEGKHRSVAVAFQLEGDRVRFSLPQGHDARYPLVIDPTVVFGSFTGSTADNFGFTATYNANGDLFGGGIVFGTGYPVTLGVQGAAFVGGTIDMAITKFTPDGTALVWSTYIGGAFGNESPHSIIVNSNDELYLLGTTGASDFPTTPGCFDNTFAGGPAVNFPVNEGYQHPNGVDLIVVHLNADATALLGSTFVGGTGTDGINDPTPTGYNYGDPFRGEIVLNAQELPVIASSTQSSNMPTAANAPFPTFSGGVQDGYLFAMDAALTSQSFASYYGGSGIDACYSVQLDSNGEVFVVGGSTSGDLPMAGSSLDPTSNGATDGFIARFDPTGSTLLSSTYLGTPAYDQCYFVQLDTADAVYVVGQTHGIWPITPGKYANPNSSQFIQKVSHDLSTSIWSTVIGNGTGVEDISPSAFLVSDCGQIYFSGWGGSTNWVQQAFSSTTSGLPITADAFQSSTDGSDFYLMVLSAEAVSLDYATFYGGSFSAEHVDGGTSRFAKNGVVYQAVCAGCGGNSDLPTTPGAWSQTNNSFNCNLGVFKIDFGEGVVSSISGTPLSGCAPVTINFLNLGSGTNWLWDFGDGSPISTDQVPSHLYDVPGVYTVTLVAIDSASCNFADTASIQVTIADPLTVTPSFTISQPDPCDPLTVVCTNTTTAGTFNFTWNMGDGTVLSTTNAIHTYADTGTYVITLQAQETICGASGTVQIPITLLPIGTLDVQFEVTGNDLCSGLSVTTVNLTNAPQGTEYTWNMGDGTLLQGETVSYTYSDAGSYTISLQAMDPLCGQSGAFSVPVEVSGSSWLQGGLLVPNVFSPNGDLKNDSFFPIPNANGNVTLKVFNRWGMKLYESGGTYKPWDGKTPGNNAVPEGVYYYILDYDFPCQGDRLQGRKVGHVQVLR